MQSPVEEVDSKRVLVPTALIRRAPLVGGVVHRLGGSTMGTSWSASFAAVRTVDDAPIALGIARRLAEIVAQMSTWEPTSALSMYNAAPAGTWHALPDKFMTVLRCAQAVADRSNGAFDATAGALVNAWGFGPTNRFDEAAFTAPSDQALAAARELTGAGWRRIVIDEARGGVLQPGGVLLDLSAIAKGFAVDHVTAYLHALGLTDSLVEIGGELRGEGIKPDGQPWWVALEDPSASSRPALHESTQKQTHDRPRKTPTRHVPQSMVALQSLSVATSGDYRRFRLQGETRLSHTIDPRSGRPIAHGLASVTVLHRECMLADAWSTALGVMGSDAGLAFANKHGIQALFIDRDTSDPLLERFVEHMSTSMQELLA